MNLLQLFGVSFAASYALLFLLGLQAGDDQTPWITALVIAWFAGVQAFCVTVKEADLMRRQQGRRGGIRRPQTMTRHAF